MTSDDAGALARLISWLSRGQNAIQTIRKRTKYLFLRELPALQVHIITLAHPDEPHMQKYGNFGEIPVPLTRTWVEDAALQTHSHTSDGAGLSPVSSHDYPEYKTSSKQYENGPTTYFWSNYRPSKAIS